VENQKTVAMSKKAQDKIDRRAFWHLFKRYPAKLAINILKRLMKHERYISRKSLTEIILNKQILTKLRLIGGNKHK